MGDAHKLYDARVKGINLRPGQDIKTDTVEAAYKIQDEIINMQSESAKGYKISMTSPETQALFDSSEPVFGPFTKRQVISEMNLADYNIPLAELELVFYVNEALSVKDDAESILSKCTVAPALELPDGRTCSTTAAAPANSSTSTRPRWAMCSWRWSSGSATTTAMARPTPPSAWLPSAADTSARTPGLSRLRSCPRSPRREL